MTSTVRNRAFRHVTLGDDNALSLERELRALFGRPPVGLMVSLRKQGENVAPAVLPNTIFQSDSYPAEEKYWGRRIYQGEKKFSPSKWSEKADILVRISRCSISQSDRSAVRTHGIVLGRSAGGYIVDPGPHHGKLSVGQKVAIVSELPCGECDFCKTFSGNHCRNMEYMGRQVNGSFAQLVALPLAALVPVENNFPSGALPLVEILATVLHSLFHLKERFNHIHHDDVNFNSSIHTVTVIGAGATGCLVSLALRRFWPGIPVVIIESNERRRAFAQKHDIGTLVLADMPYKHSSRVSIVTVNNLDSYRQAISFSDNGTVVVFSELDKSDLESSDHGRCRQAEELQAIHREELLRIDRSRGVNRSLLGSRGFNYNDIGRAVHELEHYYESRYSKVHNVAIEGFKAKDATVRGEQSVRYAPRDGQNIVEAYLSPNSATDAKIKDLIAESHKVLIHV